MSFLPARFSAGNPGKMRNRQLLTLWEETESKLPHSSLKHCIGLALANVAVASLTSNQIHKRKDQDPDEIDEVPVQAGDLDQARIDDCEGTLKGTGQQGAEINHAPGHVHPVKPCQNKECRGEQ